MKHGGIYQGDGVDKTMHVDDDVDAPHCCCRFVSEQIPIKRLSRWCVGLWLCPQRSGATLICSAPSGLPLSWRRGHADLGRPTAQHALVTSGRTFVVDDLNARISELARTPVGNTLCFPRPEQTPHPSRVGGLSQNWPFVFQVLQAHGIQLPTQPRPKHLDWVQVGGLGRDTP